MGISILDSSLSAVSTFGIKLIYLKVKIRKQTLRLQKLLHIAPLLGNREKRGMSFFESTCHRDPPLGQTDLPSTRAWVQAGKMLSASRLKVFGKPERWKKQFHAADSRECSKNVFCTLGMQSHHPDTLNYQLWTKKQDVRVHISSLDAGNHHQRESKAAWDQWGKMWVLDADGPGPQSWLSPTSTYLTQGLSLSPSLVFFFQMPFITPWHSIYWLPSLFPVCVSLEYEM